MNANRLPLLRIGISLIGSLTTLAGVTVINSLLMKLINLPVGLPGIDYQPIFFFAGYFFIDMAICSLFAGWLIQKTSLEDFRVGSALALVVTVLVLSREHQPNAFVFLRFLTALLAPWITLLPQTWITDPWKLPAFCWAIFTLLIPIGLITSNYQLAWAH